MTISATTQGLRMGVATSSSRPTVPFDGQVISETDTDSLKVYNGSAWISVGPQIAVFNETQAEGTSGGSSTTSFKKRTLNTTDRNTIYGCSIASSVITLTEAGTYYFRGATTGYSCSSIRSKIRNTTASTDVGIGINANVGNESSTPTQTASVVECTVVITGSTTFELQSREGTAKATNGLGANINYGIAELFSQLYIQRIA